MHVPKLYSEILINHLQDFWYITIKNFDFDTETQLLNPQMLFPLPDCLKTTLKVMIYCFWVIRLSQLPLISTTYPRVEHRTFHYINPCLSVTALNALWLYRCFLWLSQFFYHCQDYEFITSRSLWNGLALFWQGICLMRLFSELLLITLSCEMWNPIIKSIAKSYGKKLELHYVLILI